VFDLRKNLRSHGSDLLVRWGKLENVVEAIVKQLKDNGDEVKDVYFQKEVSLLSFVSSPFLRRSPRDEIAERSLCSFGERYPLTRSFIDILL